MSYLLNYILGYVLFYITVVDRVLYEGAELIGA